MAADENYRLANIALPDLQIAEYGNLGQAFGRVLSYLREFAAALVQRDLEIKNKVNQLHVEYTETEPTAAPDEPEPVFRIYKDNGNYYLYVYINSLWKRVTLV